MIRLYFRYIILIGMQRMGHKEVRTGAKSPVGTSEVAW